MTLCERFTKDNGSRYFFLTLKNKYFCFGLLGIELSDFCNIVP